MQVQVAVNFHVNVAGRLMPVTSYKGTTQCQLAPVVCGAWGHLTSAKIPRYLTHSSSSVHAIFLGMVLPSVQTSYVHAHHAYASSSRRYCPFNHTTGTMTLIVRGPSILIFFRFTVSARRRQIWLRRFTAVPAGPYIPLKPYEGTPS